MFRFVLRFPVSAQRGQVRRSASMRVDEARDEEGDGRCDAADQHRLDGVAAGFCGCPCFGCPLTGGGAVFFAFVGCWIFIVFASPSLPELRKVC